MKVRGIVVSLIFIWVLVFSFIIGCSGDGDSPSSAKAITAYSINGYAGTIDQSAKTITVVMPASTNVSSLAATFVHTGISIKVGTTKQISGATANDFTAPVVYTIKAANGTKAYYTVTVISIVAAPVRISRTAVSGTSVDISILITLHNFTFAGVLNVTTSDTAGIFLSPVSVTSNSDGTYILTLTTSSSATSGVYAGNITLNLCGDASCNVSQVIPSITLPFNINLMSPASAWPGNNLTALSALPGASDWETFQGNAAHTGFVPATVDPNQFSTRWNIAAVTASGMGGTDYTLGNTLTTENGKFFNAGSNTLYARSESDGSLVWSYDFSSLPNPSANSPAVKDGVVYIAAGQQSSTYFFAFNSSTGAVIFKAPMDSQWDHYLAPTIGPSGVYTNAGHFGGLYGFNFSGVQLFYAYIEQTSQWTPAVDTTGVYTYTGGKLRVINPLTGAILSSITDPTFTNYSYEIGGSPVLGAAGSVFVANYLNTLINGGTIGNKLLRFNTSTSSIAWSVAGDYSNTPAYADGVLYAVNERPVRLEARAERDGALLWSWVPPRAGDTNFKSEVLLTNNLVFVSTNLATYAIDRTTHRTVWSYPLMGRLALSRNGILYIQGSLLIAINLK